MSKPKYITRNHVLDTMQSGGRLCRMHSKDGMQWFVLPANGSTGHAGKVKPVDALAIIALPNIAGSKDALFPGLSQTYRLITCEAA